VEQALEKVFQNRWDDGQFQDSTLTYEELVKVKGGFARVWRTLHHERLKYPATTTGKMPVPPTPVGSQNQNISTKTGANTSPIDSTAGSVGTSAGANGGTNAGLETGTNAGTDQGTNGTAGDASSEPIENGMGI
jgi:hypothetical protein